MDKLFRELEEIRSDLSEFKGVLEMVRPSQYREAYKEILKMAYKVDSLADFEYSLILSRIEAGRNQLSSPMLSVCVSYVETLIRLTEEHLAVRAAEEALTAKKKTNVA